MPEPIDRKIRRLKKPKAKITPPFDDSRIMLPHELERKRKLLLDLTKYLEKRQVEINALKDARNQNEFEVEKQRYNFWLKKQEHLQAQIEAHHRLVQKRRQLQEAYQKYNSIADKIMQIMPKEEVVGILNKIKDMPIEEKVAFLERKINAKETIKRLMNDLKKEVKETKNPPFAKIKHLYKFEDNINFEIPRIEDNDIITIGYASGEKLLLGCDFKHFEKFFQETHDSQNTFRIPLIKNWFASKGIEIDARFFVKLLAFTKMFEQKYSYNSGYPDESVDVRKELYTKYGEKDRAIQLSDIFKADIEECAEIAALAQEYLQRENIPSSYFNGTVLWKKDDKNFEPHSFNIIRRDKKTYIFDPTNPTNTEFGKLPGLYTVDADFDKEMAKGRRGFVVARNVLTGRKVFYGVTYSLNDIFE